MMNGLTSFAIVAGICIAIWLGLLVVSAIIKTIDNTVNGYTFKENVKEFFKIIWYGTN